MAHQVGQRPLTPDSPGNREEVPVSNRDSLEMLSQILVQLKILNKHMEVLTDELITYRDIEENGDY